MLNNLFCTPVECIGIKDEKFITEINLLYTKCEENNLFNNNWMPGNDTTPTTFKSDDNILKAHDYLKTFIENKAQSYLDNVEQDFSKVNMTASWFNKQSKLQSVGSHNHRSPYVPQLISGVFYVKTTNNLDQGKITFKSHNPFQVEFPSSSTNIKYSAEVSYMAVQNNMMFFPSTIVHRVSPNYTDIDRVVLSFNIEFNT